MSKSILQAKDGSCYLCRALHGNDGYYSWIEEHHVFPGTANRKKSEHWGMKIYLCNEHHNQTGRESVHNNSHIENLVKRMAQQEFEKKHGHKAFMQEFGKNYLDEEQWVMDPEPEKPVKKDTITIKEIAKVRKNAPGMKLVDEVIDIPFKLSGEEQLSFVF